MARHHRFWKILLTSLLFTSCAFAIDPGPLLPAGTEVSVSLLNQNAIYKGSLLKSSSEGIIFKTDQSSAIIKEDWSDIKWIKPASAVPVVLVLGFGTNEPLGKEIVGILDFYNEKGVSLKYSSGKKFYVLWHHLQSAQPVIGGQGLDALTLTSVKMPEETLPFYSASQIPGANDIGITHRYVPPSSIIGATPADISHYQEGNLESSAKKSEINSAILSVNRSLSLSFQSTQLNYGEPSSADVFSLSDLGEYLDTENGTLHGIRFGISWMGSNANEDPLGFIGLRNLYFSTSYQLITGHVVYAGHTQSGASANDASAARMGDLLMKIGKGFSVGESVALTPYIGFGHHFWQRDLGLDSAPFGENYQNYFWDVGNLFQYAAGSHFVATADVAIGKTFGAEITVPGALNQAPLGSEPIIKAGLEADYAVEKFLHFFIGLDYTYFTYGQTAVTPSSVGVEPLSITQLLNYSFGVRFSY